MTSTLSLLMVLMLALTPIRVAGQNLDAAIADIKTKILAQNDSLRILECQTMLRSAAIDWYKMYPVAIRNNRPHQAALVFQIADEIYRRSNDVNPGSCLGDNAANLGRYVHDMSKKLEASKP